MDKTDRTILNPFPQLSTLSTDHLIQVIEAVLAELQARHASRSTGSNDPAAPKSGEPQPRSPEPTAPTAQQSTTQQSTTHRPVNDAPYTCYYPYPNKNPGDRDRPDPAATPQQGYQTSYQTSYQRGYEEGYQDGCRNSYPGGNRESYGNGPIPYDGLGYGDRNPYDVDYDVDYGVDYSVDYSVDYGVDYSVDYGISDHRREAELRDFIEGTNHRTQMLHQLRMMQIQANLKGWKQAFEGR